MLQISVSLRLHIFPTWNQIFIWRSVRQRAWAISILRLRVRYLGVVTNWLRSKSWNMKMLLKQIKSNHININRWRWKCYRLKWNSFSSSRVWYLVYVCRPRFRSKREIIGYFLLLLSFLCSRRYPRSCVVSIQQWQLLIHNNSLPTHHLHNHHHHQPTDSPSTNSPNCDRIQG